MTTAEPKSQPRFVAAVICALAGVVVFQLYGNANHGYIDTNSLFWWWSFQWWNAESETQHGWLILAIAVWLCARNLRAQARGEGREARGPETARLASSLWPLASAFALHTVGFAAQQARISIIALLLFTWGVLRLGGGRRWGRAAMFPLAFLIFAIPINVLDSLGFWLRLGVIKASSGVAHACGIGVIQSGTQLMAPDGRYNYDVAAACSGVRSLVALAALSLLIGYLNFHSWWRRALMFALCFPLVYLGNVARISAIVFAAQVGGPRWGDVAHEVMGYAVFAIVLGGVFGAAVGLERLVPEVQPQTSDDGPGGGAGLPRDGSERAVDPRRHDGRPRMDGGRLGSTAVLVGVVLLLAVADTAFLRWLANRPEHGEVGVSLASDGRNPVELPTLLGREWVGWPAPVSAVEREILPADTGYSRMNYVPSRGEHPVFLSLVLSGRDRTSIHRPELCLVAQGWTLAGALTHRFDYPGLSGAAFPATVLRVRRQIATTRGPTVVPQLVAYWFVAGDTVVATHWQRLAHDAWNRVVHGRADRWAYVLMQTDATDGEANALGRLQSVLDATLPVFQQPLRAGPAAKSAAR